ncbi:BA75_04750T0 [Komagataella pastoris]|uniref:BA75_04750T0 n=1 Tax=Komagataella pastoris TaxID=4922 RepID=A0A1B2JIY0_PICPA|nr:BA75_04750T0 [Komagataella pastoris]
MSMNDLPQVAFGVLNIDSSFTEESLASTLRKMDLSEVMQLKVTNGELTKFRLPQDIVFPKLMSCLFISETAVFFVSEEVNSDTEAEMVKGKLTEIDVDLATSFPLIEQLTIAEYPNLSSVELFHGKDSDNLRTVNVSNSFESFKAFSQFSSHILDHSPNLKDLMYSWLLFEDGKNHVLEVSLDKCPQLEAIFCQSIDAFSSIHIRCEKKHRMKGLAIQETAGLTTIRLDPTITIEESLNVVDYRKEARLHAAISSISACKRITLSARCWRELGVENVKFENLTDLNVLRSSGMLNQHFKRYVLEGEYTKDEALEGQDSILRTLGHPENFPCLEVFICEFVQDFGLFIDLLNQLPNIISFEVVDKTSVEPIELDKPCKIQTLRIDTGQYPQIKISNQDSLDDISICCIPKCSSIEISDCSNLTMIDAYDFEGKMSFSFRNCPELIGLRLEYVDSIESLFIDESCKNLRELTIGSNKPFDMKLPESLLDNLHSVSLREIDELSASFSSAKVFYLFSEPSLKCLELRNTDNLTHLYVKAFPTKFTIGETPKLRYVQASEGSQVYTHFQKMLARLDTENPLKSYSTIDSITDEFSKLGDFFGGKVYQNDETEYCHFEGDKKCPICLEDLTEKCTLLPCGHPLHDECLKELLKDSGDCPLCNTKLREQQFELKAFENF